MSKHRDEYPKWLTPEQVAERLNVTVKTVYNWLRSGQLKGVKIGPRLWRIRESELPK